MNNLAIARDQVGPSITQTESLDLSSFQPLGKLWLLGEWKGLSRHQVSLHNAEMGETWVLNQPKEADEVHVRGDYVGILHSISCYTIWMSPNVADQEPKVSVPEQSIIPLQPDNENHFNDAWSRADNDHAASTNEKQQCPLRYHGSIEMVTKPTEVWFQTPLLIASFHQEKHGQTELKIWDVSTLELLKTLKFDGEVYCVHVNNELGIVSRTTPEHISVIDIWRTPDFTCLTVPLPSNLAKQLWTDLHYDTVENSLVARGMHDQILWIKNFQEWVEGEKSPEECIFHVEFSSGPYKCFICELQVKNSQLVMAMANHVDHAFHGAPRFTYTSLLTLDLRSTCDSTNSCYRPSAFTTATLAAPYPRHFVLHEGKVLVAGDPDYHTGIHIGIIEKLTKYICMDLQEKYPNGFHWQDVNGNDVGHAWLPLQLHESVQFEQPVLEQILQFGHSYCPFLVRSQLKGILAYTIPETKCD